MRSFKSVAWVGTTGAAALVCYIFSLQVAQERAGLSDVESQIRRTERSIQTLKTELGTRGRTHQLQHWASADFGFAAPRAGQFTDDEVTLANLDMPAEVPAMDAPVRTAAAPAPAADMPRAVQAVAPAPASERPAIRTASAAPRPAAADPLLHRASLPTGNDRIEARAPDARPRAARPAASLVDARTLQAIDARARTERAATSGERRQR